jgi:hypothetical protein
MVSSFAFFTTESQSHREQSWPNELFPCAAGLRLGGTAEAAVATWFLDWFGLGVVGFGHV